MATKSPVYCPVCNDTMSSSEDLEDHLVDKHKPPELAKWITSEWEAAELGKRV